MPKREFLFGAKYTTAYSASTATTAIIITYNVLRVKRFNIGLARKRTRLHV